MADMTRIKDRIQEVIRPNGVGAITAAEHQSLLLEMVDDINNNKADKAELAELAEDKVSHDDLATINGKRIDAGGNIEIEGGMSEEEKAELNEKLTELSDEIGRKAEAVFINAELNKLIKEIYIPSSFDYTMVTRVRVVVGYLAGSKYYNAMYFHASDNSVLLSAQKTFSTLEEAIEDWNSNAIFYIEDKVYALVVPTAKPKEIDSKNEQLSHPLTLDFAPSIATQLALRYEDRIIDIEKALPSCAREYRGVNLFDKRRAKKGGIVDTNGIVTNANYYYSHPIYCVPGKYKQTFSSQLGQRAVYAICTSQGEFIKGYYSTNENGYYIYTITEPCYIMINIGKVADVDAVMFCEYDKFPAEYTPYIASLEYSNIPVENVIGIDALNPLIGKKMLVCGDSIAYGGGRGFGLLIGEKNAMQVTTNAIDGAIITIGGDSTKSRIYQQLQNGSEGMDYVIFDGGVNDMLLGNLGEISNSFTAEFDESTFCGSFEKIISTMIAKYPTAKMGYVAVHRIKQWKDDNFTAWQDTGYYTKAIEICRKWGIPVCDLTHEIPSLYEITALKNAYTRNQDGWHPTEEGYRIFYCDKVEAFMRSL